MPLTLHPHLTRCLGADDYHIDSRDVLEHVSPEPLNTDQQAAKRRRIEKIAAQYLRGRRPVILSAGLKGPFNRGWENPWAASKSVGRQPVQRQQAVLDQRSRPCRKMAVASKPHFAVPGKITGSAAQSKADTSLVATPEVSRAVRPGEAMGAHSASLDNISVPPATAPSTGATKLYSAGTGHYVRNRTVSNNPFWLRRPEPGEGGVSPWSRSRSLESSPTRLRHGSSEHEVEVELQLAVPKAPLKFHDFSGEVGICGPASTTLSSPARSTNDVAGDRCTQQTAGCSTSIIPRGPAQSTLPCIGTAQIHSLTSIQPITPNPDADSRASHVEHEDYQGPSDLVNVDGPKKPSHSEPKVSASTDQLGKADKETLRGGHVLYPSVSPASPNSSSEFVYKKVGATKWTLGNAPRSKPRTHNFSSPPATKRRERSGREDDNAHDNEKEKGGETLAVLHNDKTSEALEKQNEESNSKTTNAPDCDCLYSTQAAMLLAQMEFHECTFPRSSSKTLPRWSQPLGSTSGPALHELSPAMTPLSIYRTQLQPSRSLDSVTHGPAMSTQDLFAAASPFAISTVKKKAERL